MHFSRKNFSKPVLQIILRRLQKRQRILTFVKTLFMPLKFYLDKRKNKHGEAPVRVVWSFNGDRYQTTMGFSVPPEAWDDEAKRITAAEYNHKKTPVER